MIPSGPGGKPGAIYVALVLFRIGMNALVVAVGERLFAILNSHLVFASEDVLSNVLFVRHL